VEKSANPPLLRDDGPIVIRIVTDSSSDLPANLVANHHITVVPLTIRFGPREYVDGRDLTPTAFWAELTASAALPETAAPSAGAFLDAYQALAADGADGLLTVCISSALSATYQSAVIAAERMAGRIPIKVLDSQTVSMALGLQVLAAAEEAATGTGLDRVAEVAAAAAGRTYVWAALDTLEILKRGGRVGGAAALIGGLLDIKPLIRIEDGVVAAAGRVRTRSRAITALVDQVEENASRVEAVGVFHGDAPDVDVLVDRIRQVVPRLEPIVTQLGPVVGTHVGPGVLGVAYRLS